MYIPRMDKIGSSVIAVPDLILAGVAIVLYWWLDTVPPNSLKGRVLALVCGLMIVSIVLVIPLANNLTSNGIHLLAYVGICLALSLLKWNSARVAQTKLARRPQTR